MYEIIPKRYFRCLGNEMIGTLSVSRVSHGQVVQFSKYAGIKRPIYAIQSRNANDKQRFWDTDFEYTLPRAAGLQKKIKKKEQAK